ncbi:hypothetical protein AB0L53_16225 [Nonomuraea sp. NPDC052129]|uniref:hypothetical protein n=1 Tax=Nonomuraea sp. NPDC052129 TaxID=3154651 RepID=UPI003441D87D
MRRLLAWSRSTRFRIIFALGVMVSGPLALPVVADSVSSAATASAGGTPETPQQMMGGATSLSSSVSADATRPTADPGTAKTKALAVKGLQEEVRASVVRTTQVGSLSRLLTTNLDSSAGCVL